MADTSFSWALNLLKSGKMVFRQGWNGIIAGGVMYLKLQVPDEHSKMNHPYLYMTSGKGTEPHTVAPWLPSQCDLLASDWEEKTVNV